MATVNVHEAKTHLSRLLERVSAGEEIVIGRAGKPVAKLVPYTESDVPRKPGAWRGKVKIQPGFYEDDERLIGLFEGEDDRGSCWIRTWCCGGSTTTLVLRESPAMRSRIRRTRSP